MLKNYSIYYGEGNSVYDNAAVWSDQCHPDVTDEEWRRMKDGEEVTVSNGCFYGIMNDAEETYKVEYSGGESRQQPGKGCDFMSCSAIDCDGDSVELYAEIIAPDGLAIEDADAWSESVYDDLKAEIIRQAKDYGIAAEQLEF